MTAVRINLKDGNQLGHGPEDFVQDTGGAYPRLLVSCTRRRPKREGEPGSYGGIWEVRLDNHAVRELPVVHDKPEEFFQPHGIDLVTVDGQRKLYVISHTLVPVKGKDPRSVQQVRIYRVEQDRLEQEGASLESDEYLRSPNDIAALPDGSFYFTNDASTHEQIKSGLLHVLHLPTANVIRWKNGEGFSEAKDGFVFANGIAYTGERLLVTDVMSRSLHVYRIREGGKLEKEKKIGAAEKGLDNISLVNANTALVPAHTSILKFVAYSKRQISATPADDDNKHSPFSVFMFDLANGTSKTICEHDGTQIDAVSSAIIYNNKLYLAQIFEPYLLAVDLDASGMAQL